MVINGTDLRIWIDDVLVADAINHTLSIKMGTRKLNTKDTRKFSRAGAGRLDITGSSESLLVYGNFETILQAMENRLPVKLDFGNITDSGITIDKSLTYATGNFLITGFDKSDPDDSNSSYTITFDHSSGFLLYESFEAETFSLLSRMAAYSELPTVARQVNINNTIKALKEECLFTNRFDALYVCRGTGENSTKLNWVRDSFNLTKAGAGTLTFTSDSGYKTDGSTSKLDTHYNFTDDAINASVNDVAIGCKIGGAIDNGSINCLMGSSVATGQYSMILNWQGTARNHLNNEYNTGATGNAFAIGYNMVSRINDDQIREDVNSSEVVTTNAVSSYLPTRDFYLLAHNNGSGGNLFASANTIMEIAWIGRYLTQAEFLKLQEIFNAYIAAL